MKRYLTNTIAVIFALGATTFTTKISVMEYKFIGNTESQMMLPYNWAAGSGAGCGGNDVVCYVTSDATSLIQFRLLILLSSPTCIDDVENIAGVDIMETRMR